MQLVEALCYKPGSCGFISRWDHLNFSLTQSFRLHYGPRVDSRLIREHVVTQLVEELCYNPENCGFDSQWCQFEFFIDIILPAALWPLTETRTWNISWGVGGKRGRCVGLTILQPSCADCLEIWEPQTPGILGECSGL